MLLVFIIIAVVAVGAYSSPVAADPCVAQLSYSVTKPSSYTSEFAMLVPVAARCWFTVGSLYAVGQVYDVSTNSNLGTMTTGLTSDYGDHAYAGQLVFTLSSAVMGDTLQISVSIYGGTQYGSLLATVSQTVRPYPSGYYQSNCQYCDYDYNLCQSQGPGSSTQCAGYLYQDQNGCVELVIPVYSPYAQPVYQFYTLQDFPSSHPPFGTWVTVTGQVYQGYNSGPYGVACPGNYLNVTSIS